MFYHKKHLAVHTTNKSRSSLCQEITGTDWRCIWGNDRNDAVPVSGLELLGPAKYRDMLQTSVLRKSVEMLATMIACLLDKAPIKMQEDKRSVVGAVMGGTNQGM